MPFDPPNRPENGDEEEDDAEDEEEEEDEDDPEDGPEDCAITMPAPAPSTIAAAVPALTQLFMFCPVLPAHAVLHEHRRTCEQNPAFLP